MIARHFFRSSANEFDVVASSRSAARSEQHHHPGRRRRRPALLRRRDQHVDPGLRHVHPDAARGDAVQHQQRADLVRRLGHRRDIGVGQDHARRGFDMRREHHLGPGLRGSRRPLPRSAAAHRRRAARCPPAAPSPPSSRRRSRRRPRICVQRYENQPLRTISALRPVANWRATASIAIGPAAGDQRHALSPCRRRAGSPRCRASRPGTSPTCGSATGR